MRLHAIRSYAELKTELLTAVNYALKNIERDELEQARIYLDKTLQTLSIMRKHRNKVIHGIYKEGEHEQKTSS